jgi:hypothetical protein
MKKKTMLMAMKNSIVLSNSRGKIRKMMMTTTTWMIHLIYVKNHLRRLLSTI